MDYPNVMDHIEVLREKIGRLRLEIAQIQESNKQYRLRDWNDAEAQAAHGQRQERLQAIQQELAQLATLGRKVQSVEEMKERHRSRFHLVKKAS
jgi:quinol monooxygenase YgiN